MYREQEKQRQAARSFKVEQFARISEQREESSTQARHFVRAFSRREVR